MEALILSTFMALGGPAHAAEGGVPGPAPLIEHRQELLRAHRTLKYVTAGSLAVTAGLGVINTINQPTLLGDGRCATGDPIFGSYGCDGFSLVHGTSGVLSTASYTATMSVALAVPRLPDARRRDPFDHGGVHRGATWVHVVGMAAMPLLGLTSANPQMLGIEHENRDDFSRSMRTVHVGTGLLTGGAYFTTLLIEEL